MHGTTTISIKTLTLEWTHSYYVSSGLEGLLAVTTCSFINFSTGLCLVSGRCLEGIRRASGRFLEGVWKMSGVLMEGAKKVSLEGVRKLSQRHLEGTPENI